MKSSYHLECKFCDVKKDWESTWLPVEILQAFANVWILFHALRYHPHEMTAKRFTYAVRQVFWSAIIIILYSLLTILQIVFYPLWWLLGFLYDN